MRNRKDICKDLSEFYSDIYNKGVSTSIVDDRKKFIELKNEVKEHFPKDALFNKKIYFTSSFDYDYPQMQEECSEMLKLVCNNLNNEDI